ncbi:MAG: hypothetical protein HY926_05695 [Elusimicrobia bacterium]|nr:hypothetical protein [Elusimicrobiota bacterium]
MLSTGGLGRRTLLTTSLAAAAALLLGTLFAEYAVTWTRGDHCAKGHVGRGEQLIHGVGVDDAWAMPLAPVADAFVCHQQRPWRRLLLPGAALLGCALLVFGLGRLLAGDVRGALAVLLFSATADLDSAFGDRWLYVLIMLLVAYALVWRATQPSFGKSLLLGAAIGMSLLALSPLFLFPLVWVVYEEVWDRSARAWSRRAEIAAVCLIPLAMLTPWTLKNWVLHHRFIPLENGRPEINMITGALGLVSTVSAADHIHSMAGIAPGQSVLLWAGGEVLRRPGRYLRACLARVRLAASFHPALFCAGLLGFWACRRRKGSLPLALLVGYYVCVHCLMSVEAKYFYPVWPLAAVFAACLLPLREEARSEASRQRFSVGLAAAVFAPLAALQFYAQGLVLAFPRRSAEPGALHRELAEHPAEAWLWSERGMGLLRRHEAAQAAADLSHAFSLDPSLPPARLAWALLADGAPSRRALGLAGLPGDRYTAIESHWLKAFYHLQQGAPRRAREEFLAARALLDEIANRHRAETAAEHEIQARLQATHRSWVARVDEILGYWPVEKRLILLAGLQRVCETDPDLLFGKGQLLRMWSRFADEAVLAGRSPQALEALRRMESLPLDPVAISGMARAYGSLGRPRLLAAFLMRTGRRRELEARLWVECAAAALRARRRDWALEALRQAAALEPDPALTAQIGEMYLALREYGPLAAVIARSAGLRRLDAASLICGAEAALRAGRTDWALKELAQAETLAPDRPTIARMADVYWEAGEYGRLAAFLERPSSRAGIDPGLWLGRAEAALRAGRPAGARAALSCAEKAPEIEFHVLRRVSELGRKAGASDLAQRVLERMLRRWPDNAGLWTDLGRVAARAGQCAMADQALSRWDDAVSGRGRRSGPARTLQEALAFLDGIARVCGRKSADVAVWADLADLALQSGDAPAARDYLGRAAALPGADPDLARVARTYQTLQEPRTAMQLWDRLVSGHPPRAQWLNDRGVLLALTGDRDRAIADLRAAIAQDRSFLPAYLSLGSLYAARGARGRALRLYEQALASRSASASPRLLRSILRERDQLVRPTP